VKAENLKKLGPRQDAVAIKEGKAGGREDGARLSTRNKTGTFGGTGNRMGDEAGGRGEAFDLHPRSLAGKREDRD